ncbi:cytochrome P460 family protein [Meiothermus hypogaeus]|uniref:Cytochrome P460 domain-containing protein n=2 Tax=Meiothermus hypogaeus TaxID=884155 RepID=A0A511R4T5_9DEIN|nr:cytochrome P460 family protein [Meiothermus hypogaeus]RIH79857.1 Cytochrome P460 [Meiothermus hypogaeus]GEM84621.1 hypothetical protein MHY01S_27870 [Meiothermus hypogaeus NBRC 106114]GIW36713.1 MAG: hypothetical protein KatS3mg073_0858 [Meiothermus sp.]
MKQYVLLAGLLGVAIAQGLNGVPAAYAGFAKWEKVATSGLPTGGPHAGQAKVVYANPAALKEWKSGRALPVGSIVVKTAGPTRAPTLIATMEKRRSGWYYEEYFPEGGRYVLKFGGPNGQQLCVGCHTGVQAKDFLFTRP